MFSEQTGPPVNKYVKCSQRLMSWSPTSVGVAHRFKYDCRDINISPFHPTEMFYFCIEVHLVYILFKTNHSTIILELPLSFRHTLKSDIHFKRCFMRLSSAVFLFLFTCNIRGLSPHLVAFQTFSITTNYMIFM